MGTVFTVYNYFRNPQIKSEKEDALFSQRIKLEKEDYERRFKDLSDRLDGSYKLAQNHIHTVDTKVDILDKSIQEMGKSIVRLATIIEERIPKK